MESPIVMRLSRILLTLLVVPAAAYAGFIAFLGIDTGRASICHGAVTGGSLEGGRRLPLWGDNYRAYSTTLFLAGRTFMHSAVRDTIRDAYDALAKSRPELRFIYAEAGWPWGGRFAPHKTHRNGTAVDFLVPVRTLDGKVDEVPTNLINHFGYEIEFDKQARSGPHRIDFDAMALHLLAMEKAARARGVGIDRVIFDIDLQPLLLASEHGAQLRQRIKFNRNQSWVRHDEHYHVDFDVPCR